MILHNCTSILITIRFQKFGSSYIEYIPNDEQKAIEKGESLYFDRLLGTLLSNKLSVDTKMNIMEQEYDISTEKSVEEDMSIMCNLGQGIEDKGIEKGEERMGRLINKLMELNCQDDIKKVISGRLYRKKLFEKFEI